VAGAGIGVIDAFSLLTAQHLAQEFLVVGAQLPEPTENVTSVLWPGALLRGSGLSAAGEQDTGSVSRNYRATPSPPVSLVSCMVSPEEQEVEVALHVLPTERVAG
jgi:hypothetical protein